MPILHHILVPLDFSAYTETVLPYAVALAHKYGAKVTCLHVIPIHVYALGGMHAVPLSGQVFMTLEKDAKRRLAAAFSPQEREQLDLTIKVIHGVPFAAIIEEAKTQKVDLIIMATHGRTGLSHFVLGSVAEKVIREAPCPVLTIRSSAAKETE